MTVNDVQAPNGDIVLVGPMGFTNNGGAGALVEGNKWLIKSLSAATTQLDGLVPDETLFGDQTPDPSLYTGPHILILIEEASVMPDSLSFGDQQLGTTSAGMTVTLSNPTDTAFTPVLSLSGANPGDFDIPAGSDNCSSGPLGGMSDCTFDVTFGPTATGARTAQVDVATGTGTNPTVDLDGNGVELDFGDAPTDADTMFGADYPVTLVQNGARHVIGGPFLGAVPPDADADGQPTAAADGDDTDAGGDDEESISTTTLTVGVSTTVDLTVTLNGSATAFGSAWIDLNQDGVWSAAEQLANDLDASGGMYSFVVTVPPGSLPGTYFARGRVCSTVGQCNTPTGQAPDGEVEDFAIMVLPAPVPFVDDDDDDCNTGEDILTLWLCSAVGSTDGLTLALFGLFGLWRVVRLRRLP